MPYVKPYRTKNKDKRQFSTPLRTRSVKYQSVFDFYATQTVSATCEPNVQSRLSASLATDGFFVYTLVASDFRLQCSMEFCYYGKMLSCR